MSLDRREVLLGAAATLCLPVLSRSARAETAAAIFAPKPGAWRTFEITTQVDIAKPDGRTQVWVPVPGFTAADWTDQPVSF